MIASPIKNQRRLLMKKIIVTVLSLFVIVGIALASYLCVQRNALDEKLITILKQEIAREYPDIGYSFTCSLDGTLLSHPLLNEMPIKKLSEMFDASEEKRITTILTDLKTQKELLIHDIKDPRENSVELFMLKADDTLHGLIFFSCRAQKVRCRTRAPYSHFIELMHSFSYLLLHTHTWHALFYKSKIMVVHSNADFVRHDGQHLLSLVIASFCWVSRKFKNDANTVKKSGIVFL